jgi:Rv0078B-related antitoxin
MEPTPENLARLRRERILRARRMTPEQKLTAGPQLFSLAVECMRTGVRLQHPHADDNQVRTLVRERLTRQRLKDERPFYGPG